jgi:serine/threonine protein kinase
VNTVDPSQLELVRPLGEGASGTVWVVREKTTGRLLARKRLTPTASQRELTLLVRLRHPNIIALDGWGFDADGAFLLTKLYAGDLALPAPERLPQLLSEALRGLAFLHSRGLVHGDLKPQNLLLDEEGHLSLADFGLVTTVGGGDQGGTLAYMSPERLAGAPADTAGDLYSLGAAFTVALGAPLPAAPADGPAHFSRWLSDTAGLHVAQLLRALVAPGPGDSPRVGRRRSCSRS